jgi:hypothetical protein
MDREAIEEAIEVLEDARAEMLTETGNENYYGEAITALRQTLEEKQEPVAWRYALDASVEGPRWIYIDKDPHQWLKGPSLGHALIEPLYTAPPKQWVGLTDEDIDDCEIEVGMPQYEISSADLYAFARVIEAKLKEKNT